MLKSILEKLLHKKIALLLLTYYFIIFVWWIVLNFYLHVKDPREPANLLFTTYGFLGLFGVINGLRIAKKWGGWDSKLGRGLIFLCLGLLGQTIGLSIWLYYNLVLKVDVPYPAWSDAGYFSIIPFNVLAMISLGYLAGVKFSFRSAKAKFFALFVGILMVSVAYFLFLKEVKVDFSNPVRTFLDFGYPLGEALVISMAITVYGVTTKTLGGTFKIPMIFTIYYLFFVFLSDYSFLYTAGQGTYYNGSWVDLVYATENLMGAFCFILYEDLEVKEA